jgi:hypothetical protein
LKEIIEEHARVSYLRQKKQQKVASSPISELVKTRRMPIETLNQEKLLAKGEQ